MDEEEIETYEEHTYEVNCEALSDDEEYQFQFIVQDSEYDEVIRDLKAGDSDAEETIKIDCPHEGCKKSFTRKHNLIKHLKSHENVSDVGSVCHICGKTIKGVFSLHLKTHDSVKQFRCDDCGKEFRQKVALNNHVLIHRDEKPYACSFCNKCFRQKYTMQHHMKNRHIGVKEHICELCGKEFADRASLQKHTLVHSTNKPHQCNTCFMTFRHKSSLSRHNKIHLKVTQCVHCDRSFRYESFLKKHIQTAHKSEPVVIDYIYTKQEVKDECINVIAYEDQPPQVIQVEGASNYYQQPISITISNVHSNYTS